MCYLTQLIDIHIIVDTSLFEGEKYMLDIIEDTLIDGVKLLPFLFVAFLIIELFEHKLSNKNKKMIAKAGRFSPIVASILGVVPQCGFSVMATNLYVTRVISLGTLIAVYLSTSDEMLPILISEKADFSIIIKIIIIKVLIAIIMGVIIDLIVNKKKSSNELDYHICCDEKCDCDNSILKSSLIHTLRTFIFIFIVTFILNTLFSFVDEVSLEKLFMKNSIFTPFIASLIGLIPNCAASVMLTELFLNNVISFASLIAGLLTGSGVAIIVLFKSNKNIRENITILGLIYFIGAISGFLLQIIL